MTSRLPPATITRESTSDTKLWPPNVIVPSVTSSVLCEPLKCAVSLTNKPPPPLTEITARVALKVALSEKLMKPPTNTSSVLSETTSTAEPE